MPPIIDAAAIPMAKAITNLLIDEIVLQTIYRLAAAPFSLIVSRP